MKGSSVSAQPTSFGTSKLLSASSLGSVYSGRVALSLDEGCTAISSAVIGSGITLCAFYLASVGDQARLCYKESPNALEWLECILASPAPARPQSPTLCKWLDTSANYVQKRMNLFSDDDAPFGFSSFPACPIDSEHLERSFDLLRYQHAVRQLGVPSVVDNGIYINTRPTGSQSYSGTSSDTHLPNGSPDRFLDRPRRSRIGGSNNGAVSGSGSGDDGDGAGGAGGNPTRHKPSSQRVYKLGPYGSPPPPPPPPPPPGYSDVEDDDHGPGSSRSDWDIAWKTILLGAVVGHLLNKFFPNRKLFFRKVFHAASEADQPSSADPDDRENEVNIFGTLVDEVLLMDADVCLNCNHTGHPPIETLSGLTTILPYDSFLTQLLTFSAGTGKAIAVLLLLVACAVWTTITAIVKIIFHLDSTAATIEEASTFVVRDGQVADDDTVCVDSETVEASAPGGDLESTVVFGNAWLWADDSETPVEAIHTPVEDSDLDATATFENIWAAESQAPLEALAQAGDSHSEIALCDDDLFWTTTSQPPIETCTTESQATIALVEETDSESLFFGSHSFSNPESQAPVEAFAPVEHFDSNSQSAFSENDLFCTKSSLDGHFHAGVIPFICVEAPVESGSSFDECPGGGVKMGTTFLRTKRDDFDWDRHGSFQCSTPLTRATGTLPEAGSFDYARGFFGSLGIDSNVADATTTDVPTIAADALQELEITKKNLDTIIEAQIKRAESSYGKKSRFGSHLHPRDMDRSFSWANSPRTSSGGQGASSSSSRLTVGAKSFTPLPHFPINIGFRTPNPNTSQIEVKTLQQAPGRRRRYRRNHGRLSDEQDSMEEDEEGIVSSDVPDWANL